MTIVNEETDEEFYLDENLRKNLDIVKDSVLHKGWDYPAVIAGIPGVGKSTLSQQMCKYLDPTFEVDRICFTAKDFIDRTTNGKKGEAYMLDESFADMNSSLSRDPDFLQLMNHLQLIRQKGLFLFLVLPDFFSLNKNIAIFRTSHLFVVYADNYQRGRFAAFDRGSKRELYIKGKQFCNYQAIEPNFRGRFVKKWLVDYETYEKRKYEHLQEHNTHRDKFVKQTMQRNKFAAYMHFKLGVSIIKLSEISGLTRKALYIALEPYKEKYQNEQSS